MGWVGFGLFTTACVWVFSDSAVRLGSTGVPLSSLVLASVSTELFSPMNCLCDLSPPSSGRHRYNSSITDLMHCPVPKQSRS